MSHNRLQESSSPYLQQHADNPVHWHPWDDEALERARTTGKPILLSVGYSACHWCHVMAHESFEDAATADVMNELYVNIKLDREERPDLDQIYQLAHQMLTQRGGGWPLTMFLTPDEHIPFFGGTYFPPQSNGELPGFKDLLKRVSEFYHKHQDKIEEQNTSIMQVFKDVTPHGLDPDLRLEGSVLDDARQQLITAFDAQNGGFGGAPKFPQTPSIERLLKTWRRSAFDDNPDLQALFVASKTLTQMANGGLFDHIGGGFFRYTVDHLWHIPHFEKMTSDNAQLLALYAQAWRATGDGLFGNVANMTADWLLREMRHEGEGFYTALDADSEGHEGLFYVWKKDQLQSLLSAQQFAVVEQRFGLNEKANFEGQWHLIAHQDTQAIATTLGLEASQVEELLSAAHAAMYAAREQRERPFCDTKQLTAQNAQMIRALSIAGRCLERDDLVDAAQDTLAFVQRELWDGNRLQRNFKDGKAQLDAYLNDYAYLLDAGIELLQSRWSSELLTFCTQLADVLMEQFHDPDGGGFFFTAADHEKLLHRMMPVADDASPSGNGIAALALNRLGHLLGETRYIDAVGKTLRLVWPALLKVPHAHCSLLDALDETLHPVVSIVIRDEPERLGKWQELTNSSYNPWRLAFAISAHEQDLPGSLSARVARPGGVAYVCEGHQCREPITDIAQLADALKGMG